MADVVNTVAAQLEQVRPILQEIFETSDQISSLFKKNSKNVTNLSRYLYRIPLQQFRGGTFKKYSANEGSLGKGTGMLLTSLQAGYFYTIMMFRVTDEQVDLSKNSKQSVVDVMSKTLADGMVEAAVMDDVSLHGDGTGELTNPSSATNGTTTLTFQASTDTLGISRLREGMAVDVWDSTATTKRAPAVGAPLIINSIDYSTNTITFNQTVTGLTLGDLLTIYDVAVYGPATPTSFSAGWPATGALTTSGGLTNDSYRHGIYYAHDGNSSNYYLGKLKSSIPQLQPTKIDCGGQQLTFAHGFLGLDKIRKRRSPDVAKGMITVFPLAQRWQIYEEGTTLSNVMLRPGEDFGKSKDLVPTNQNYSDTFDYCGMTSYVSKRQYNDRVDACNLKNWARAEVFPLRPYEKQGKTVFEGRGSDGLLNAYSEFGFQSAYDFVCYDPGAEFFITNAQVPNGY